MKKVFPYIAIILAMLCWAGSGIAVKAALMSFRPLTMIVLRFTVAVLLMLAIGLCCRGNAVLGLQRVEKKDIPLFCLGGLFQPFLYYILETYSYKLFASPTIAEALLSTSPLIAPLFAWLILRERVTVYNIVGIIVSTAGVLLLILAGAGNFELGNPLGIPLAFVTVSTAVAYTIVLRRIPTHYSSLTIVFYVQAFSLLLFYPLWGIVDGPKLGEMIDNVDISAFVSSMWAVGYLAVLSSVVAFILFCYTVREIGVTRANAFNNARPVFTALIMWLGFGEQLPAWKWVGILIIILGLFICQKTTRKVQK